MSTCERCGAQFSCAVADQTDTPCWCMELAPTLPLPGADAAGNIPGCLCPGCLREAIHAANAAPGAPQD